MPKPAAKKSKTAPPKKFIFDLQVFLDTAGAARQIVKYQRGKKIYSQGDPARGVNYIQKGGVKLAVINESGKEAVVAILSPGDFFGEGCLAGQQISMGTATAIVPTSILFIKKKR
jgi:CRP/FNR family transcriptional regulator, cyclic AMP receptor protein